jgi:tripartite-type tricarboxylate transporter receptor subunit TctC
MKDSLGQPIIIENVSGANGSVSAARVPALGPSATR